LWPSENHFQSAFGHLSLPTPFTFPNGLISQREYNSFLTNAIAAVSRTTKLEKRRTSAEKLSACMPFCTSRLPRIETLVAGS